MFERAFTWILHKWCRRFGHAKPDARTASFTEYGMEHYQCPRCRKMASEKQTYNVIDVTFRIDKHVDGEKTVCVRVKDEQRGQ